MSIVSVGLLSILGLWQMVDCDTEKNMNQGDALNFYETAGVLKLELLFINSHERLLVQSDTEKGYSFKNKKVSIELKNNNNDILNIESFTYKKRPIPNSNFCFAKK